MTATWLDTVPGIHHYHLSGPDGWRSSATTINGVMQAVQRHLSVTGQGPLGAAVLEEDGSVTLALSGGGVYRIQPLVARWLPRNLTLQA